MTNYQQLQAAMFERTVLVFDKYKTLLQSFDKLWSIINALQTQHNALHTLVQQQESDTKGETNNKTNLKKTMTETLLPLANKAYVWAQDEKIEKYKSVFDINKKTFTISEEPALAIAKNTAAALTLNAAALEAYKITPDHLTNLQNAITAFENSLGKPSLARVVAQNGTKGLATTLAAMMDMVKKCDHLLIAEYASSQPVLVAEYTQARRIGKAPVKSTTINITVFSDATNTQPLPNATVAIPERQLTTLTDAYGKASLSKFKGGTVTVAVTAATHAPYSMPCKVLRGKTVEVDVVLQKL